MTSCACLLGSDLKVISYWFVQAFILFKSLSKLVSNKFILSTIEKGKHQRRVCCLFWVCQKMVYKYTCGTSAWILDHGDNWPFNTTLCCLSFKKSVKVLKRLPDILICFNLKLRPLCHTLLKSLGMSKNSNLTSWLSSKICRFDE